MILEIVRRPNCRLHHFRVQTNWERRDLSLDVTPGVILRLVAIILEVDPIIWSTYCDKVVDWELNVTSLHNVATDKGSLR